MNIFLRTASPLLATGSQLKFDHALRPECQSDGAIEVLSAEGMKTPSQFANAACTSG